MPSAPDNPSNLAIIPEKEVISRLPPPQNDDALTSSDAEKLSVNAALQPYSSFAKPHKWLIILLATFAASFSPLSSFIFFPTVTALSESLQVSITKINLTITSYLIVAGIAPAILGDLADSVGRRVVYLLMMTIYCTANIALAIQRSWAALFVLRMVQSVGSAGRKASFHTKNSSRRSKCLTRKHSNHCCRKRCRVRYR